MKLNRYCKYKYHQKYFNITHIQINMTVAEKRAQFGDYFFNHFVNDKKHFKYQMRK